MQTTLLIIILGIISFASLIYIGFMVNNFFKYFLTVMKEVNAETKAK